MLLCCALLNNSLAEVVIDSTEAGNQNVAPCLGSVLQQPLADGLVFPNGKGLPVDSGTATQGEPIFQLIVFFRERKKADQPLESNIHEGYDHGYCFMAS